MNSIASDNKTSQLLPAAPQWPENAGCAHLLLFIVSLIQVMLIATREGVMNLFALPSHLDESVAAKTELQRRPTNEEAGDFTTWNILIDCISLFSLTVVIPVCWSSQIPH